MPPTSCPGRGLLSTSTCSLLTPAFRRAERTPSHAPGSAASSGVHQWDRQHCSNSGSSSRCSVSASAAEASSSGMLHAAPRPLPVAAIFHLAFPVRDIEEARAFYGGILGCPEGRSSRTWVDFSLYGHQIVAHHVAGYNAQSSANEVDGDAVPVPHFGLALSIEHFHALAERVAAAGVRFEIEPHLRFVGAPGEQWTMFFKDPSGTALEFKAMTNPDNLFARYTVT